MNGNDNQYIAIFSSIVFLKEQLTELGVPTEVVEQAFDIQQQITQYNHTVNDHAKVLQTDYDEIVASVRDNSLIAGLSEEIANQPNLAVVHLQSAVVELRTAIRKILKRTTIYCAAAALVGGIVALAIPSALTYF